MKRLTILLSTLVLCTSVHAQIYQWKDESGKTVISDKPPVGTTKVDKKGGASAATPTAPAAGDPATQKSLADRDMEFRKRQKESQEASQKAQQEQTAANEKKAECEQARRALRSMESGERIALRDEKGERYFMDDAQRAQEIAKARKSVQTLCQ